MTHLQCSTLPQARSVKDAFVLNHQYMHRYYTHTLICCDTSCRIIAHTCKLTKIIILFPALTHPRTLTRPRAHTEVNVTGPTQLEKVISWVFTNNTTERHRLSVFPRTLVFVRIDYSRHRPDLISNAVLGPLMSGVLGPRDELQLASSRSIHLEVIGLMCSPEPWCVPRLLFLRIICLLHWLKVHWTEQGRPAVTERSEGVVHWAACIYIHV